MYTGEKYGFEPFGSLDGVLRGDPIRIMPVGTFYRDERKLEITAADLQAIERNVNTGLPRFRIPINENHQAGGKLGTIKAVQFMAAGPDGAGLYATDYELTDEGRQLVAAKRYDAVSPEMVWKKNGATYQDPQTGKKHDNVLVGLALTDRPFFGHANVALFSADAPKRGNGYTKLRELMRAKFDELMTMVKDADGDGEPDELPDMPAVENAADAPTSDIVDPAATAANEGANIMDKQDPTTPAAPDAFAINAEEFAALKAKADKVEAMEARLAEADKQAEQFAAQLRATNRARRLDQLTDRAEKFMALGVPAADLAAKFQALEEADAELYKFFDGLLESLDARLVKADLFGEIGDARTRSQNVETFEAFTEKVLVEKFDGDRTKYEQAMEQARRERPELYAAYSNTYNARRKPV